MFLLEYSWLMAFIKNTSLERFISKSCQYGNEYEHLSMKAKNTMSSSIRNFVYEELPERNLLTTYNSRPLTGCDSLQLFLDETRSAVFRKENKLWVMSSAPDWSKGLRGSFPEKSLYDYISWFFHFAQQYVSRASFVDVISAIAIVYDIPTHFYSFESRTFQTRTGLLSLADIKAQIGGSKSLKMSSQKQKFFQALCLDINCLDPFINRAFFNYVRALELNQHGFYQEAVLAFDKSIDVVCQYFTARDKPSKTYTRDQLSGLLSFNTGERNSIESIYKIRCYFSAHPAQSKWWDFGEVVDVEHFYFLQENIRSCLLKFLFFEKRNRVISKQPDNWHQWFCDNWEMLWDSIWYEKLNKHL